MIRKMIRFSVEHSLFVNLVSVFIVICGLISLLSLNREAFPNVNYDMVMVQAEYLGAPPEEIEKLITIKIEDELKEVNGIDEMVSTSSENRSMIILQLDPDEKDKRKVVNDIQRAVDRVDDLPADVEDPVVNEIQTKDMPVITVSLWGDFHERDLQDIAEKLETQILDLPAVARIDRVGWRDREIWVEVRPKMVDDYHLSLEDVVLALRNQNLNLPAGTLTTGRGDFLVRTIGEFETAEEVREVIIRANDLGNWIKVKDVAEVKDTFEDDDLIEKTSGRRAINLTVVKKERSDIIQLVKDVKETVSNFQKEAPEGLKISYFEDLSYYVKRRLNVLINNGTVGVFLVLACLIFFLAFSSALWTAVGVAVSLMFAFSMMFLSGLSINLISMFALIMVLGMVVDDAIIVSENTYRHMEDGMPSKDAAVQGATEVAAPVVTAILTTIAAFTPLFIVGGIMGKYIRIMPMIVIIALGASLLESLFILPSHLADFGRVSANKKSKGALLFGLRDAYLKLLAFCVRGRYFCILFFFGLMLFAGYLFMNHMRFVLFPPGLIESFFVKAKAPIETSLDEMDERVSKIEAIIDELPENELDTFVTRVGIQQENQAEPFSERGSHVAQIQVYLTPDKRKARRHANEIIEEIRRKGKAHADLFEELTFSEVRAGPPVGKPVTIRLRGEDLAQLKEVSVIVQAKLNSMDGLEDVRDDFGEGKPELLVKVDEAKATKAFLSVQQIATSVRNALDGGVATTIQKSDEEIDVIVRYPQDEVNNQSIFDTVRIPNRLNNLVPLNKVASLEEKPGVNAIKRFDRKRMIYVTANVDEKKITPIQVEGLIRKYFRKEIAAQYPEISIGFGGEQEETKEFLVDFMKALGVALFFIFMILAANFNSVFLPLIIMAAIPFGIVGVIFAFFLHGQPPSFMAMLGVIGLSGVVVNDSIVLVDFVQSLRRKGVAVFEAIMEAGKLRLRPVILTTVTTGVGLMPVAYGVGGSDPFLKPMALAVSWGICFATVLTLILIPCLYAVTEDGKWLFGRIFRWALGRFLPKYKEDYAKKNRS